MAVTKELYKVQKMKYQGRRESDALFTSWESSVSTELFVS